VRGHVQGVRCRWRHRRIVICSRNTTLGESRKVVAVYQVVQGTWVIRLLCQYFLGNAGSLKVPGVSLVCRRNRDALIQSQGVEHCSLCIIRITRGKLFHGLLVSQHARRIVRLV
jgi:hypothetical protein